LKSANGRWQQRPSFYALKALWKLAGVGKALGIEGAQPTGLWSQRVSVAVPA
jgi:hypothetical protein